MPKTPTVKCFNCGRGRMTKRIATVPGDVRGEGVTIDAEASVCDRCGFQVMDDAQSAAYGIAVADAYRHKLGLLTSQDLKAIRRRLAMSQIQFAAFLKVGQASVKRWEAGLIQDEAMDELIRLKTSVEAAWENLREIESRLNEQVVPR